MHYRNYIAHKEVVTQWWRKNSLFYFVQVKVKVSGLCIVRELRQCLLSLYI